MSPTIENVKAFLERKFPTHLGGIYTQEEADRIHDRREELSYDAIVVGRDSSGLTAVYVPEHSVWVPKEERFVMTEQFVLERDEAMEAIYEALQEQFVVTADYYCDYSVYDDRILAILVEDDLEVDP